MLEPNVGNVLKPKPNGGTNSVNSNEVEVAVKHGSG